MKTVLVWLGLSEFSGHRTFQCSDQESPGQINRLGTLTETVWSKDNKFWEPNVVQMEIFSMQLKIMCAELACFSYFAQKLSEF